MFDENNNLDVSKLQGSVPGESLTGMPGSKPWEKPPQFVDMDELLEFMWDKFNNPDYATVIFGLLKAKTPVDAIARTLLFSAFAQGVCTVDMALLALPTVMRQLAAIGKFMGVKDIVIKSPNKKKQELFAQVAKLMEDKLPKDNVQGQLQAKSPIFSGLGI